MRRLLPVVFLFAALPTLARHVVFVDNTRPSGGDGTAAAPVSSIADALRSDAGVIRVAETTNPYNENITLKKGQMLVGSAYSLDALQLETKEVFDAQAPAQQGAGPIIHGTINVLGDNVIAGCTIVADRTASGISSTGANGTLTIRNVLFRTAQRSFGVVLSGHIGAVMITGGGLDAASEGSGLFIGGGAGDVTIDRFPMTGIYSTAIRIADRSSGAVAFRNGSQIHVDDAIDDAIVISNITSKASVSFADRMQIRGRRRALVANDVAKLAIRGSDSWLAATGAAALELHNVGADIGFDALFATGGAEGVVIDKVRGRLDVLGVNSEAGSGGVIRGAKTYGIRVTQSSNVHLANMTLYESGSKGVIRGAKCAGEFEVNTTAPCNAALYVRHVESSSFERITVDGGGAMGLNANNIRDVKFEDLEIRGTGDESFEAGVLLQELRGNAQFRRCKFTNNAGSEVMIEQRFNSGRVTFDRCLFAALDRPMVAASLIDVRGVGNGVLAVDMLNSELNDNAGSALTAASSGTATLALTVSDTTVRRIGVGGVNVAASDASHLSLTMTRTDMNAPAANSVIDVSAAGSAQACVELNMNAFSGGAPPLRFHARDPQSLLQFATRAASPEALIEALAVANNRAVAAIDAGSTNLAVATTCATGK